MAPVATSAYDLLVKESSQEYVVTSSSDLDHILNGGIPLGQVTEICTPRPSMASPRGGTPGAGKTQLCIQLAMNVQLPPPFAGVDGHAVYIGQSPPPRRHLTNRHRRLLRPSPRP